MRGLLYLECRYALHETFAVLRSPLRLTLWTVYVFLVAAIAIARAHSPARGSQGGGLVARTAEIVAGSYVGAIGATILTAAGGRVLSFRNAAEPILFLDAGLRPLQMALWLQLRRLGASGGRWIGSAAYLVAIFAPPHAGFFADARLLGIVILATALPMSAGLPTLLLARTKLRAPIVAVGVLLAAGGFSFAAISLFAPMPVRSLLRALHFDPGGILAELLRGNAFAVLTLVALLAALGLVVAGRGGDALPELYAASERAGSRGTPPGRAGARFRYTGARSQSGRVPSGAATLIWKDWVGFRREGGLRVFLALALLSTLAGTGAALVARFRHDAAPILMLAALAALLLFLTAPAGASLGLGNDLAKPLFWLSEASLRTRLLAWTFARTWRTGALVGLGMLAGSAIGGNAAFASAALPLALAVYWLLQSIGVALFAVFPNAVDSRGPMLLVRSIATVACLALPLAIGFIVVSVHGSPLAAAFAAATSFALEGWILIELTALALEGGADAPA